ncbi:MAG: VOC family protein [Lysinibacillus sp.]
MTFKLDPKMKLGHLHLLVQSLTTMASFYKELGLHVLEESSSKIVFAIPENTEPILILETSENVAIRPARTTGLFHFAILVPTREDLAYVIRNLLDNGIAITGAGDHIYSEAFYLNDPEGNGIEIYYDRPRSEWLSDGQGGLVTTTQAVDVEAVLSLFDPNRPWTGLPKGASLGHMHLNVSVIDETTTHFYIDALGMDIMTNLQNSALFISAGGYHHHIAINVWQGVGSPVPPENTTGLLKYSLLISSEEELQKLIANIMAHDIPHTIESGRLIVLDFNQDEMIFYVPVELQ